MRGIAIAIVVAVTQVARGEPIEETEAGKVFEQARELASLGHHDEACPLFEHSYRLDPALGTAINLADCLERAGQLRRAWELFEVVARDSLQVQSRARLARARADALLARLATLIVRLHDPAAPGLAVRIGDRKVKPAAEIREVVELIEGREGREGREIEVLVTQPGRPAWRARLRAVAGTTATAEVPAFAAVRDEPVHTRRRRSRVYVAGGLGAAGGIGLGASLGLAISAKRLYDGAFDDGACVHAAAGARCTPGGKRTIDRAGTRADVATGFAIGGALVAGVAAALYLTAPREAIQVSPIALGRELGVGVAGRF